MGACSSAQKGDEEQTRARALSRKLERKIDASECADMHVTRLLVTGPAKSGKSTLMKQARLFNKDISDAARREYVPVIMRNVVEWSQAIAKSTRGPPPNDAAFAVASQFVLDMPLSGVVDSVNVDYFRTLWNHVYSKNTVNDRSFTHYDCADTVEYFLDRLGIISAAGYVPSLTDVFRCCDPKRGIVDTGFEVMGNSFALVKTDQPLESFKKWIHCFEHRVSAVVFVASLADYDVPSDSNPSQTKMEMAFELFSAVSSIRWHSQHFPEVPIVLFFNKRDVFETKLRSGSFQTFFPTYRGHRVEDAIEFIEELFMTKRFPNPSHALSIWERGVRRHRDETGAKCICSEVWDVVLEYALSVDDVLPVESPVLSTSVFSHSISVVDHSQNADIIGGILFGIVKDIIIRAALGPAGLL